MQTVPIGASTFNDRSLTQPPSLCKASIRTDFVTTPSDYCTLLQELAQDSAIKMVEKRETDWLVILVEHDNDPKYQKKKSGQ